MIGRCQVSREEEGPLRPQFTQLGGISSHMNPNVPPASCPSTEEIASAIGTSGTGTGTGTASSTIPHLDVAAALELLESVVCETRGDHMAVVTSDAKKGGSSSLGMFHVWDVLVALCPGIANACSGVDARNKASEYFLCSTQEQRMNPNANLDAMLMQHNSDSVSAHFGGVSGKGRDAQR